MSADRLNRVLQLMFVAAALLAASCSKSETAPTPGATYQGQWSGAYRVDASTPVPSSAYAHMCNGFAAGVTLPLSMTLTQNAQAVNGQFTTMSSLVENLVSPGFVSIADSFGGLQIRSVFTNSVYQYDFQWRLSLVAANQASGSVSLAKTGSAGLVGGCNIEGTIIALTK